MSDPVKFTEDLLQSMANMLCTQPVSENGAQCLGMGKHMFMTLRDQATLCHHRRFEAKGEPHHSRESTFHN